MPHKSGYKGWLDLEMDAGEKQAVAKAIDTFENYLDAHAPELKSKLKVAFTKAQLTITPKEAKTGAWHKLAGGTPFYQIEVTGDGDFSQTSKAVTCVMYLSQIFGYNGGASMSMDDPIAMTQEFSGNIQDKVNELVCAMMRVNDLLVKTTDNSPQP